MTSTTADCLCVGRNKAQGAAIDKGRNGQSGVKTMEVDMRDEAGRGT